MSTSSRLGLRFLSRARPFARSSATRPGAGGGRMASSDAAPAQQLSFLQRSWQSPIGIRTVHFWAPVMKWVLVLAGIGDMARPADRLSLTQNAALTATGFIWTRWCFVIRPKNILLATVNFFVGCVGAVQVSRVFAYRAALKRREQQESGATTTTHAIALDGSPPSSDDARKGE